MANGRMINHAITKDLRINQLSDDTSRLAFTWLIPFADREGRTYGDPAIVRSMLFPRREDISIARMTEYIQEWDNLGLIVWYEADGDKFIFFPAFEKNQRGMRPDRESASIIPAPPIDETSPELVRSNDGVSPDESRIKLKEIKLKQEKGTAPPASDAFSFIQQTIERLTGLPITPNKVEIDAINEMVSIGITEDDLIDAVAWFKKKGKIARGADGLLNSAKTSHAKRIQAANPNGSKSSGKEAVWVDEVDFT